MTRARAAAAAFACSFALAATGAHAAPPPYASSLVAAAQQLEHAANAGTAVPPVHLPPAPLGGPPRFSPSLDDWLQRCLDAARKTASRKVRAAQLRAVASSLRYVAAQARGAGSSAAPKTDVAAAVRSILAQPAYNALQTKPAQAPPPTIWERILQWIGDKLNELFGRIASATQSVPVLGEIIGYALIAAAIAGLAFVGYRIARRLAARRTTRPEGVGEALPAQANADALYGLALERARDGDAGQAVALAYQAALVLLDRSDRVEYDASRTAGEYRRIVARRTPSIASFFDALARLFVAAAFGDARLGDADWRRASTAFVDMRRVIGAREAA